MEDFIALYTDGSASGNPGPGGIGVVLIYNAHRKELSEGFRYTTNNRMELRAVITGITSIRNKNIPVKIYSDSRYVVEAINQKWVQGWKNKAYKGKANADLWEAFLDSYNPQRHEFIWVKGHASNTENNRCDELAVYASKNGPWREDEGYVGPQN